MHEPKWLQVLEQIGPIVLSFTPAAGLAAPILKGIGEAHKMAGVSNAEKLAHVLNMTTIAANATNAKVGRQVIDPAELQAVVATAVSAVVQTVNVVHAAHVDPASLKDVPLEALPPMTRVPASLPAPVGVLNVPMPPAPSELVPQAPLAPVDQDQPF